MTFTKIKENYMKLWANKAILNRKIDIVKNIHSPREYTHNEVPENLFQLISEGKDIHILTIIIFQFAIKL